MMAESEDEALMMKDWIALHPKIVEPLWAL